MAKNSKRPPKKPTGITGPFSVGAEEIVHHPVQFPETKSEIEDMIAGLFIRNAGRMPLQLAPFSDLERNREDDLDFSITCGDGQKRLFELAEFAPLQELGVSYRDAPRQMGVESMTDLANSLINKKSKRQGGTCRLLLLYQTNDQFFLTPPVQEFIRRKLNEQAPAFDAVYYLSPHNSEEATVYEIWPGQAHPFFADLPDESLGNLRLVRAYPDEFVRQVAGTSVIFTHRI